MKFPEPDLADPIYLKRHGDMPWPKDKFFYLLAANGLFICRNQPFFTSCVPARKGPAELANQQAFLTSRYPKIPQPLMEQAVGFFAEVGEKHGAEAALLLAWDTYQERYHLLVPKQRCSVYRLYQGTYPLGVHYELPTRLSDGWSIVGDIHSHVNGAAYASYTDKRDERYQPGLHIVVGRIHQEPPEFHVDAIVDGMRFMIDQTLVIQAYHHRARTSQKCLDQVEIVQVSSFQGYWHNSNRGGAYLEIAGKEDAYTCDDSSSCEKNIQSRSNEKVDE